MVSNRCKTCDRVGNKELTCCTSSAAVEEMWSKSWGYDAENGPENWHKLFPHASGKYQSPIDITADSSKELKSVQKLIWHYTDIEEDTETITNTGYSWQVKVENLEHKPKLVGGPLKDIYVLEQFHCHWGETNDEGSEHTLNGERFAGELHLVHWNSSKYKSFGEAAQHSDGLCVLGVFLKSGREHEELGKIVKHFPKIQYKNEKINIIESFNPDLFIPQNSGYYTYQGSLTTPPCTECVIWIVFKEPIEVSEDQLHAFRSLKSYYREEEAPKNDSQGFVTRNFRPTLPLGQRDVHECCI